MELVLHPTLVPISMAGGRVKVMPVVEVEEVQTHTLMGMDVHLNHGDVSIFICQSFVNYLSEF